MNGKKKKSLSAIKKNESTVAEYEDLIVP